MRPSEIENWTLKIIDQLKAKERIEESRVEVKTIWIDPKEAARKLAGHANAARGDDILWIIGVDEKNSSVVGVKSEELAVWWERVRSEFDGIAPSMVDVNVLVDGTTVVALLFETDRAPFVVKNPSYGKEKDQIKFEVPWREGTSTRTASRNDLIQLLVPISHSPRVEVIGGELTCSVHRSNNALLRWNLVALKLYVEPVTRNEINFAFHRCEVSIQIPNISEKIILANIRIKPPYVPDSSAPPNLSYYTPMKPDTINSAHTESEIFFQGPGRGDLSGNAETHKMGTNFNDTIAIVQAKLSYSHGERPVIIEQKLNWRQLTQGEEWILSRWTM